MAHRADFLRFQRVARLSQWVDARFTMLGKHLAALGGGALLFALDPSHTTALTLLAGVLACFGVACLSSRTANTQISGARRLPRYAVAGVPLDYEITLTNHGARSEYSLSVRDELATPQLSRAEFNARAPYFATGDHWFDRRVGFLPWLRLARHLAGGIPGTFEIPVLASGASAKVRLQFTPLRRGKIEFLKFALYRPDPFGMVNRILPIAAADWLLALPRQYPMPLLVVTGQGCSRSLPNAFAAARTGNHEFHALREYRVGDPLRHIHWRTSAKRGALVVRQFTEVHSGTVQLFVDTATHPARFEALIETAASLAGASFRAGAHAVDFTCLGATPRIAGRQHFGRSYFATSELAALEYLAYLLPDPESAFNPDPKTADHAGNAAVFLLNTHWDSARQRFAERLALTNAQLHVLLVTDSESPSATQFNLNVLNPHTLAHDLALFDLNRAHSAQPRSRHA
ncbi:MAG: DUF58 domain-containing protein [Gammaproteobacteria bacterium]|nr:DUF58 domain-containing protein [Gammaproteobacteria bacterium]